MTTFALDCDGVLYLGETTVPGAGEALNRLEAAGHQLLFVTNNATKSPRAIAKKINDVVGFAATADQVIGSAVAAASMLRPTDAPVLVFGERGLTEAVLERGLDMTDQWRAARAVIVGLNRSVSYTSVADAASAVRSGARFVAANTDPTYPTPEGLLPGAGTWVAAIAVASGREPEVAGKPNQPMIDMIRSRATREDIWVVGDRVTTDLAMAEAAGWTSVLVLSGVDDAAARLPSGAAPDHVVMSIVELPDLVSKTA